MNAVEPTPERGQIFTGVPGGRIVGPEQQALKLSEALNDLELHFAFEPDVEGGATRIYSRDMMAEVGVDFPVIVLPESVRAQWEADTERPAHLQPYDGQLPRAKRMTSFGIVTPGKSS